MKQLEKYQGLFHAAKQADQPVVAYSSEAVKDQAIRDAMASQSLGNQYALAALLAYSKESPLQGINWDDWYRLIALCVEGVANGTSDTLFEGVKAAAAGDVDREVIQNDVYAEASPQKDQEHIRSLMQKWHDFFKGYEVDKEASYGKAGRYLAVVFAITQGLGAFFSLMFFLLPTFGVPLVPAIIISVSLTIIATWVNYDLGSALLTMALNKVSAFWQSLTQPNRDKDADGKHVGVKRYNRSLVPATVIVAASSVTMALLFYHSVVGIALSPHGSVVLSFFTHGAMAAAMPYMAIAVGAVVGLVEVLFFSHAMIAILRDGGVYGIGRLFKKTYENIKADLGDENPHKTLITVLAVVFFTIAVLANFVGIGLMVRGTVSDLHSIAPMLDLSIRWAWAAVAGIGMAFFFIKSSVGWSYDASKSVASVPTIKWATHVRPAVKSNGFAILGVAALIACAAIPGVGIFIGLAALSVALVFNRMVKKGAVARVANAAGTGAIVMAGTEGSMAIPAFVSNGLSSVFNTHVSSVDDSRYTPSDKGVAQAHEEALNAKVEPDDEGFSSGPASGDEQTTHFINYNSLNDSIYSLNVFKIR